MSIAAYSSEPTIPSDAAGMDKWQHLMLRIVPGGSGQTFEVTPPGALRNADSWNADREGTLALLNDLGDRRWQLVTADFDAGVFWMKRVFDQEDEGIF